MGKYISFLGGLALLFLSGCANSIPDEEAIVGSWRTVAYEENGEVYERDDSGSAPNWFDEIGMTFLRGGKGVVWMRGGKSRKEDGIVYVLDPGKNPKQITMTGDGVKKTVHAIYTLEGDTLRIALYSENQEKAPGSFSEESLAITDFQRENP
ncbi:MAG: TIGR03067 domain-containing protein [Puniceicoccales bacterium]|jgi:uncharacterized protein (TIGR03067 family)|nr:TIGR03067 domain-containing protein [Puniceicoccales bacterium]